MRESIFHISHTDVAYCESRIIKQLEDIKNKFLSYNIFVIGIKKETNINNIKSSLYGIKDLSVSLITKKLFFLPKFVRYFFNYLELLIKCIFIIYNKKITIVHCHFFTVLPIGYVVKLLFKCKLIYDAHELESHKNLAKYPRMIFLIEKFLWKKIDLFITTSPSILNWYNNNFGYKKNSIIILNSPKIKNHILKSVAHDTLVQFISSANVGLCIIEKVSLSDFYCLPNKLFEYAFANLYILASNFPDMKRLIKTYSLGSCIPPNVNALIRKIKFLENNKKKTKVLKRNLVDLQWQSQSQILIRSYLNILKKTER